MALDLYFSRKAEDFAHLTLRRSRGRVLKEFHSVSARFTYDEFDRFHRSTYHTNTVQLCHTCTVRDIEQIAEHRSDDADDDRENWRRANHSYTVTIIRCFCNVTLCGRNRKKAATQVHVPSLFAYAEQHYYCGLGVAFSLCSLTLQPMQIDKNSFI